MMYTKTISSCLFTLQKFGEVQESGECTKTAKFTCSFCGLPQPSQHVLNDHYLDHVEEDCKYCSYCCFTCQSSRTLKKHEKEHAAHNQMCHRHCSYTDMHDPHSEHYLGWEESKVSKPGKKLLKNSGIKQMQGNPQKAMSSAFAEQLLNSNASPIAQTLYKNYLQSLEILKSAQILKNYGNQGNLVESMLSQISGNIAGGKTFMEANLESKNNTANCPVEEMKTVLSDGSKIAYYEKLMEDYKNKIADLENKSIQQEHIETSNSQSDIASLVNQKQLLSSGVTISLLNKQGNAATGHTYDYSTFLSNSSVSMAEKIQLFFQDEINEKETSHACPFCSVICDSRPELTRHLTHHSEQVDVDGKLYLRCPQCPFCSSSKSNLHRHIATHSRKLGAARVNGSEQSNGSTSLPSTLNGKTLLFCTACDYTSYYKSNMNRHMARHAPEEAATAGYCSASPPDVEDVNSNQEFSCGQCIYTTNNVSNFRRHSRLHTRDKKLWSCCLCTYSSYEKSNVKRHIRMKHPHSGEGLHDLDPLCYVRKERTPTLMDEDLDEDEERLMEQNSVQVMETNQNVTEDAMLSENELINNSLENKMSSPITSSQHERNLPNTNMLSSDSDGELIGFPTRTSPSFDNDIVETSVTDRKEPEGAGGSEYKVADNDTSDRDILGRKESFKLIKEMDFTASKKYDGDQCANENAYEKVRSEFQEQEKQHLNCRSIKNNEDYFSGMETNNAEPLMMESCAV